MYGSDAMNINGKNGVACAMRVAGLREPVEIRPPPGLPVIRHLIVDMSQFFKQYHSIMNCVDVCPKELNSAKAIGKIKEMMVRRTV